MEPERRKTKKYTFKSLEVEELRKLGSLIIDQDKFYSKYGRLLYLLRTKMEKGILSTLIQFYDSLYHCFTFLDYQLLPTLEEYSSIIGLPITGRIPFTGLEQDPKLYEIAISTHLRKEEVEKNMVTKGGLPGLPAEFLIKKALTLSQERKEEDFEVVFALLVYGLFLFRNINNFVDMNAIKIFMKKNPVPTLLRDTYYSIHLRNSYGKGMVTYCTPLLYKWYISHMPDTVEFWSQKEGLKWSYKIMTLTNTEIVWINNYFCRMKTLDCCGDFPNVPLIGTKGEISYSPALARRRFGFPIDKRPRNNLLEGFFLEERVENKEFRERIANAWHPSHILEIKDWKTKGDLSPEPFDGWVTTARATELRMHILPGTSLPSIEKPPLPHVAPPTIESLQEALRKMKKSRDHWKRKFESADAQLGMIEESYEDILKEKNDQLFLQETWLIAKDATISKYAREKKRKKEEKAPPPKEVAWKSIIEKLEKVKLKKKKKKTQDDMDTSH
ncbi:uncharacterized protein LOC131627739 [Vicia villosa]|uniref:uncharacterized protein LOC131627739 n=1 Tax=Vicia villosa TaxID=3911 RepID=UPI00273B3FF5|nr:uncharacterized protein LOC131627739 [Vicia villosa]